MHITRFRGHNRYHINRRLFLLFLTILLSWLPPFSTQAATSDELKSTIIQIINEIGGYRGYSHKSLPSKIKVGDEVINYPGEDVLENNYTTVSFEGENLVLAERVVSTSNKPDIYVWANTGHMNNIMVVFPLSSLNRNVKVTYKPYGSHISLECLHGKSCIKAYTKSYVGISRKNMEVRKHDIKVYESMARDSDKYQGGNRCLRRFHREDDNTNAIALFCVCKLCESTTTINPTKSSFGIEVRDRELAKKVSSALSELISKH